MSGTERAPGEPRYERDLDATEENELLRPTLGASDDIAGFDRPWNPSALTITAFFLGPFGGGWLFFENFRRLGRRREALLWLAIFVSAGVAYTAWVYSQRYGPGGVDTGVELARTTRHLGKLVAVVLGCVAAWRQAPRWRLFTMSDGEPGKLWAPIGIALAIALAVPFVLLILFRTVAQRV